MIDITGGRSLSFEASSSTRRSLIFPLAISAAQIQSPASLCSVISNDSAISVAVSKST